MKHTSDTSERGMALVLALMFISIALLVLGSLSTRLMNQRLVATQYEIYQDCFVGVDSALTRSRVGLETGSGGAIGVAANWTPVWGSDNKLLLPAFGSANVSQVSNPNMPDVKYMAWPVNWFTDGRDSNGNGQVDDSTERDMYSVYARAKNGDTERTVEAVYDGTDVNVWRNAIFAGAGQAGGVIAGNTSIHGSVHLLGENLAGGGVALAAMDLTGSSLIHNNYAGMPATLSSRIPAIPTSMFGGQNIGSLDAKLRVKRGRVGMSGSSEIGQTNSTGNTIKETMDGTYVSEGWTGNSVSSDGERGDPSHVYSDNGWDEEYDLGDKVKLPVLIDDWRDPVTGARTINPATGTYYTHQDYFNQVLLAVPTNPNDGVFTGNITLSTTGNSFYWNATTNTLITGTGANTATPGVNDDYIKFDSSTDVLRVNGQVRVNGNISLTGSGNQKSISYSGRAALLVYGTSNIDTSLVTCNNGVKTNTANSFPANNILGLMSTGKMTVGASSQLDIMGAFYSATEIATAKQTNVVGTFVSQYFNMGSQVPSIFQVPALAENLPVGMIGNYPLFVLTELAWRELGV